jgi:hypothetical protein
MSRSVLLGGADVFHLVGDYAMRRDGAPGNHCAFAVTLDGRIDLGRLERRLARAVALVPELRFRLVYRFPLRPRWTEDPDFPLARVDLVRSERPLVTEIAERLAKRVDGHRPWVVDVLRGLERDTVLLRTTHSLVDAKGTERLVRWLGSGSGEEPAPPPPREERFLTSERPLEKLDRETRTALSRACNAHIKELGRKPILSLRGAMGDVRLGAMRYERLLLTREETAALDRSIRKRAKLAESSLMLYAATRVFDDAMRRRGFAPPRHLIPMPLSLDPKAGSGRILGNHLTMMMFALDRDDLADEPRALASLAEQQRTIVRDKLDLGMAAALDFARWLPPRVYDWMTTRPFGGEMASFVVSNPGSFTIESFAGLPVVDAFSVPAVGTKPGFQMIFMRFGGCLSALMGYYDGLLPPDEARAMLDSLKRGLFGETERG